jgi:hypothetical protein
VSWQSLVLLSSTLVYLNNRRCRVCVATFFAEKILGYITELVALDIIKNLVDLFFINQHKFGLRAFFYCIINARTFIFGNFKGKKAERICNFPKDGKCVIVLHNVVVNVL